VLQAAAMLGIFIGLWIEWRQQSALRNA